MSILNIILLDISNNTKKIINIIRPNTYQDLLDDLKQNVKNLPEYYKLYILDKTNKAIEINNEQEFCKIEDILYVHEIHSDILGKSIFEINYDKLPESKKEILDEKYNCILCTIMIKNELPFFCYKCQKIFHEKCIKDWDKKRKEQNKILSCPNCRYELSIEKWNKKLDFEDKRKEDGNSMDRMNQYKLNNNMISSISLIKDKKINQLKESEIKQDNLIKKYKEYIEKTIEIFRHILKQIYSIHLLLELIQNNKLSNLINIYPLNLNNLDIKDISNIIFEELEIFKKYIKKNDKNGNQNIIQNTQLSIHLNNIKDSLNSNKHDDIIKNNNNKGNILNSRYIFEEDKKEKINKKINNFLWEENEINIIYCTKFKDDYNIFGEQFVENNKENLELIINGKRNKLISNCQLQNGENIIKLIIKNKNKLTDLSNMFNWCDSLKDIKGLSNLDVKNVKDFSYMFYGCPSLTDINPLQGWDVSNGNDFSGMFCSCSSLSDIRPLQKWNVLNGNYFSYMFSGCSTLSNLKPLKNWNVSNGNDFSYMFSDCSLLTDIRPLLRWNVSNGNNFYHLFNGCNSLLDLTILQKWDVSQEELKLMK